jgi:hypothetical protein
VEDAEVEREQAEDQGDEPDPDQDLYVGRL